INMINIKAITVTIDFKRMLYLLLYIYLYDFIYKLLICICINTFDFQILTIIVIQNNPLLE
ncbi:hypothetical protein DD902_17135, partial [Staphylococcus pseudintermedius]